MKYLLLSTLILFTSTIARAQYRGEYSDNKNIFISLGGEIGAPSNTPYSISYGGYFGIEAKVINRLDLTLTAEYMGYHNKSSLLLGDAEQRPSFVPLKAGLKYYTNPRFYFAGEAGAALSQNSNAGSMFVYSLGFGFDIPVNKLSDVDVGFAYQSYAQSQYQTTGLKVAYRLGW